ncbi:iron ABC transporter permease [Aeromicrobium camelliae]|uniref:Iron ABC transporter permease n=1 Tax=Aeromicrobium camelliae TaxID=1538144 RepID=A0A3N6W5B2_9ACTN|nr:iron ABC transporter permease [Aeromicrobium camelliae]RQN02690.1 iron ABC transporter permease [Aeromicrobium camelliae]
MRRVVVLATLTGALLVGLVVSARVGQLPVSTTDVVGAALARLGITSGWAPSDEVVAMTLEQIRFPRVALSALVGAALAVGGAVMQAIFGNPLAEPGVVGVSSGAALGAAAAIASGVSVAGGAGVAAAAFVCGFLATFLVYVTARANGRTEVVTLLLTGIAVNAFAGAGIALVMFVGDTASREQIVFWQLGSLNGARWHEVAVVTAIVVPTTLIALALARRYDLLSLGERSAAHLGVRVEALRVGSIALVALLTAAAVAFAGIISFVGLVVPHSIRMLLGPSHRGLLAASAIAGAALLVWCDLLARTAVAGADLPIGMITALIGGPFFFVLIRQARSRAGGWG